MSRLSVFIDESGDFGPYAPHSPYFGVSCVFHDQEINISSQIQHLHRHIQEAGFSTTHAIHTGPLIRREAPYQHFEIRQRKKLFCALFNFVRLADISYKSFLVNKKECANHDQLALRVSSSIATFVAQNLEYFQGFDEIVVYYDDGQKEISRIIHTVFNVFLRAEIRCVHPNDYSLFQAADMFCTLRLLEEKCKNGQLSKSESAFFGSKRDVKKNFLKPAKKKELQL